MFSVMGCPEQNQGSQEMELGLEFMKLLLGVPLCLAIRSGGKAAWGF